MKFDRQAWLARLTFSFFIVGAVLLWLAYQHSRQAVERTDWRVVLYAVAGTLCLILGGAGMRARHADDADRRDRE